MNDPFMKRYVPDTDWFGYDSLDKMMRRYDSVYIKPDVGRQGGGIIRVKKLSAKQWEISSKQTSSLFAPDKVYKQVKLLLNPKKKYIVQQGIDLATYHRCPFDVRVVLQKPLGYWRATLMSAKVAPRPSSLVTNVAKGAKDHNVYKVLRGLDQSLSSSNIMRDLMDISHQTAQILNSRYSFKILGLDLAVDKNGKVWFIEANTMPDNAGLENVDRSLYSKYLKARKLMRSG
ncbi:YheC/YheD family protein [Cohnella pontilimi]|nr:YheC/YheD family protein [Cohnella pontilimi]